MADIKSIRRGDTKKYRFELTNGSTGEPIPANGTLTFTVKLNKEDLDADAIIQVSVERTNDDPVTPDGKMFLLVPAATTKVEVGKYYYDFQFQSASGEITTVLPLEEDTGKVKIL
ncbi:MAG: hypothetical protein U9Q91_00220, partial [Candidatus Marinimicrobia bacterium]|nr:hypothetical protein [Candidatus Neomarinimicrobiota bacterium]